MAREPSQYEPLEEPFDERLQQARAGSQEALGRILEACRLYLLRVANRELDSDVQAKGGASDLVQESFLRAREAFGGFRGSTEAELLAWLRRILVNDAANFKRHYRATDKRQVSREVGLDDGGTGLRAFQEVTSDAPSPSSLFARDEATEKLAEVLQRLPDDYRQVIVLRYWKHYSFAEIGEQMGRSANAIRKLWLRAIERMHGEWERCD